MFAKLRDVFFWLVTPIQKLLQRLSRPEPEMTRDQVSAVLKRYRKGDLLVSYEGGRLTSPFIPGDWDHLAVINNEKKVIEAIAPKVRAQDLEEWLFKKKGVALVRYTGNKLVNYQASIFVNKFVGWPYDYLFKFGNKKAYCSEIGFLSYHEFDDSFMSHVLKNKEITPQDFYDAAFKEISNLKIIYEVRN
mgnify:FL=1